MKRDMDLIRSILLEIEKNPQPMMWVDLLITGHTHDEISYHVMLLYEAGLIDANDVSSADGMDWKAKRLTYQGHEFLDSAREETLWNKAKETVKRTTGTLTIEAMKIALSSLIRAALTGG
jgi:DNA-binding transcriptional ArsR family regulator